MVALLTGGAFAPEVLLLLGLIYWCIWRGGKIARWLYYIKSALGAVLLAISLYAFFVNPVCWPAAATGAVGVGISVFTIWQMVKNPDIRDFFRLQQSSLPKRW